MRKILAAKLSLLGFCILVITTSVFAQNNKGAIVGSQDPNDAVVPKAQIKVTSMTTARFATPSRMRRYVYRYQSEPGIYDVSVEATGFEPVTFQSGPH